MYPIADAAIPAVTFLMMVAVGHGLTPSELLRSATDLRAVITGTVGQLILLPLIATVIVLVIEPSPTIIAGLILVAACPGGTVSNFYACLAHGNTALSLALTATSCLLSFVSLPILVATGFVFWLDDQPEVEVPVTMLVIQLLLLVALPTCIGMILRRWHPAATERRDLVLRRVSLVALVALVAYVAQDQWTSLVADLGALLLAAVIFTVLAMIAGYILAWVTGRTPADRLTYLIEFPCRNLALALVVAVTVLGRPDIVAFAAVLLLVQALVVLSVVVFLRREHVAS
jgi:BASS family bile acid:Na+ symporter